MNPSPIHIAAAVALAAALASLRLPAQTAPSGPVTSPASPAPERAKASKTALPSEKEVIELSPFQVNTTKDTGFMAVNAGTATKLALDLQDMPAAYSVMTREFIDTLQIRNLQDASSWATSGSQAATDGTPNDSTSTPNRVFTQQRGQLNQLAQQRDFFLNAGIGDTYSAERIDFGRGPNALLFNFGDINNPFAGGTSIQTKKARLDQPFQVLSGSVGSWDNFRATADVNQPIDDKAAIRANVLWQNDSGWRVGAMDNRKGLTLSALFKPTPKTEINAVASDDHFGRTQTYADLFDQLSGWDGVTVVTGPISSAMAGGRSGTAPTAGTPNAKGQVLYSGGDLEGIGRFGVQNVYIPGEGIMNWQNMGYTRRGDDNDYVPVYNNGRVFSRYNLWQQDIANGAFISGVGPSSGQMENLGLSSGNGGVNLLYQPDLPDDRFARALSGSPYFKLPDKRYTVTPRTNPLLKENDRDINISVLQKFTDTLYFTLAFDANQAKSRIFNQGSANRMRYAYIDINQVLPDGAPNPHFLQVYSDDTTIAFRNYEIDDAGVRPSLNYILDLRKWGNYTFNLGAAAYHRKTQDRQFIESLALDPDSRKWAGSNVIKVREYWSDPMMPLTPLGNISYFNNAFNSDGTVASSSTQSVNPQFVNNGGSDKYENDQGVVLAMAGRYFHSEEMGEDHLVILAGLGFNELKTYQRDMMIRGDIPAGWDSRTMLFKPDAPSDWASLMYTPAGSTTPALATNRPRLANVDGVAPPDPRYAQYRFRDDYNLPKRDNTVRNFTTGLVYRPFSWVDAKLNYSNSNIPPVAGVLDVNQMPALPTAGFGEDARLGFTPFGDRFVFNAGYFYDYAKYMRGTTPIASGVNSLYATRGYLDTNAGNRNEFSFVDLKNLSDYFTRTNTGYEFEAVGRIMPGLEVTGSYSRFRTKDHDHWPLTPAYVAANQANFLKQLVAAGGRLDTTTKPVPEAPGTAVADTSLNLSGAQATNQQNAVNAYNSIWTGYDRVVQRLDDTKYGPWGQTFNFFARYEVRHGLLRRLRVGLGATWKSEVAVGNHAGDVVPNPNYDKTKPFNTNAGLIGSDGHYTYKDSTGAPTGYNAPWMPDPSVNQLYPYVNWSPSQTNVILTLGYSHRLDYRLGQIQAKTISYNLVVNNLFDRQRIERINGTGRAPDGDFYGDQNTRILKAATLAGYQEPISFNFTTTIAF